VEALVGGITITPDGKARAQFRFDGDFQRARQYARAEASSAVNEQPYGRPCRYQLRLNMKPECRGNAGHCGARRLAISKGLLCDRAATQLLGIDT
jgi:hypothetical protein